MITAVFIVFTIFLGGFGGLGVYSLINLVVCAHNNNVEGFEVGKMFASIVWGLFFLFLGGLLTGIGLS